MKISESFFDQVKSDFMSFNKLAGPFIGDVLESTIFMTELFKIMATEYADSGFANFGLFSWVEFNPKAPLRGDFNELIGGQDVLVEIFEILDNGIAPENGGPQNARLYDLLVAIYPDLVISFHAKYNRNPNDLKIQDLAADELSTILVDLLLHIREVLDGTSWNLPIKKHSSYSVQTFAHNRFEASNIFESKLQMNSMLDLQHESGSKSRKSILASLYKFRVAKLINARLRENPATNYRDAINKIQELFDDWYSPDSEESEIRDELYALAKDTFIDKAITVTYVETIIKYFSNEENLNKMLQFTSSGTFELTKYETIDFLFDSGEKLTFEEIPSNLFTLIGGKKVDFTKARFNYLVSQGKKPLLVVRNVHTGQLGVVGSDIINDLPQNIREGYAYFDTNTNREIVLHNIYLSNPEGNRLFSKLNFDASGFTVRSGGDKWFKWLLTGIKSIDGLFQLNYYRALGWATGNRFIAFLQEVEDNIMTVPAYQSLITVDKIRPSPKWLKNLKEENSFLDPEFNSHENRDFILDNSKQFLDRLSLLTDLYVDTSVMNRFFPIDNYDLQILGAYMDENGLLHLGPGYDDLELGFRTLLVHYLVQFGDIVEANEFALELCSLKKVQKNSLLTIQNVYFNPDQTRKQWLQNWIDVFRQYQFTDSNSLVIEKMNEIIINREKNFVGGQNEFDLSRDNEKFDKREILLAKRVVSVLTELFGKYMFKEMLSGGVMVMEGKVQFMSRSMDALVRVNAKINSRFSKGTPYEHILDRFTSSFNFILPTDGTVDVSDATISLSEVPVKFLLPMYKKPTGVTLHSDFSKFISRGIYEHYKALNHFKRETLRRSWRSQFYKTLMQICRDRGYDSLQLSLADVGLRSKIFAEGVQDFRNKAFEWLTSRGESWVTLTFSKGKGELILSPDDFRRYFKDDWAKFASSLYLPKLKTDEVYSNQIESDLRYMQDFIMDTLGFIFDLAESAENKRIILYPFNAFTDGYGADPKSNVYLPPNDYSLNEWYIKAPRQIGFLLDLNDQDSINNFVEMIPILLGNLLVRPAAFIVRDPDHPDLKSDECMFTFGMSGSLLPSQMIGSPRAGPPKSGMKWVGGSEIDYKKSSYYLRWNEIISRHNTLSVHKFDDPNKFYEIVRRILFTNVDDVAFYF